MLTFTLPILFLSFATRSAYLTPDILIYQLFYYLSTSDKVSFFLEAWWSKWANYSSSCWKWGFHCCYKFFFTSFFSAIWLITWANYYGEYFLSTYVPLDFLIMWYFRIYLYISVILAAWSLLKCTTSLSFSKKSFS